MIAVRFRELSHKDYVLKTISSYPPLFLPLVTGFSASIADT